MAEKKERLLVIDTCGECAGVALSEGRRLVGSEELARGSASAEIMPTVQRLLEAAGWALAELDAVGVVSGPGPFTGVRVGMAAAKGLCEAAGLRLVAVSRLEVLAEAAGLREGFAVLDAGRGEVYVREVGSGREWLAEVGAEEFAEKQIVAAEERVVERLRRSDMLRGSDVRLWTLGVGDAVGTVLRRLRGGEPPVDAALLDAALLDANYVRGEKDMYRKMPGV